MGLPMKRQLLKSIAKSKQKGSPRDDYKVRKPASRARDGKNGNKKMISSSSSAPPYKGSKGSSNDDKTPSKGSKESSNGGKKGNFGRRDWKQEKKDAEETEFETVRVDEMMDDDEQQISSGEEDLSDSASDSDGEAEARMIDDSLKAANRKGKKSGGFQSMGLSLPVFKAIGHMGYRVPTPIQRKAIPVILEGRDIVAMARTGSGKTAAFIIPLLERLKAHSAKVGVRALILSPSRELAMQTLKFCKDLGKHTDLRNCVLVGGDAMEDQFSAIASNPDVIIATPGRLLHLIVEMSLELKTVQYVVFDEADRLFEMGFAEQLREILHKLPEMRQTLLFSATMPKTLVEFARAGLSDPALIRLDVDTKISKDLQLYFLSTKKEQKDATLVHLLRSMVGEKEQVIIFAATKHHVEYLHELLNVAGIQNTYIYGALDQQARRIHLARFRSEKEKILIVTDVAARGIDIPLLDHVINYDFPATSKVFIHRVGRVARAGRTGKAWSLVSTDEIPYMIDLQLFTSRPLVYGSSFADIRSPSYTSDIVFGYVPDSLIAMELEDVIKAKKESVALDTLTNTVENANKMYYRSRPTASKESYKRSKEISLDSIGIHPVLALRIEKAELDRTAMVENISKFRPSETVFEIGKRGLKTPEALTMQKRRSQLSLVIGAVKEQRSEAQLKRLSEQQTFMSKRSLEEAGPQDFSGFIEIKGASKKRKMPSAEFRDGEHFMSYQPADANIEKGYALNTMEKVGPSSFMEKVGSASFDVLGDDEDGLKKKKSAMIWDSKKHRFIRPTVGADNKKMIRTESGALLPASYKTKRFADWQHKRKIQLPRAGESELSGAANMNRGGGTVFGTRRYRHTSMTAPDPNSKNYARNEKKRKMEVASGDGPKREYTPRAPTVKKGVRSELKSAVQIQKDRNAKDKRREKTGRHFRGKPKKGGR